MVRDEGRGLSFSLYYKGYPIIFRNYMQELAGTKWLRNCRPCAFNMLVREKDECDHKGRL
jgi:hypothetical protein